MSHDHPLERPGIYRLGNVADVKANRLLTTEELQSQPTKKASQSRVRRVSWIMIDHRRWVTALDSPIGVASRQEISRSDQEHCCNTNELLVPLHGASELGEQLDIIHQSGVRSPQKAGDQLGVGD